MYKNMSPRALGVSGRQSELIELALTYGFRGMDADMADFAKRCEKRGEEHARRFIESSKIRIGGWELPTRWQADDVQYKADLAALDVIAEKAARIGGKRCYTMVPAGGDTLPYHEFFERSRSRLREVGGLLAKHDICLGVGFYAAPAHREGKQFQFIHKAEELLSLVKSVASANVGLAVDTWNWFLGEGGLDQLSDLSADDFVIVRLADLPEGYDPGKITEQQRLLPRETGPTVKLLSILAQLDYSGPITVFPHPKQFSGMTRDAIVQRASAALDEQWRAAGLNKTGKLAAAAEA
jgi:sugar phosphate isomerase/epimerase